MPPAAVPISPVAPAAAATMVFRENGQLRVAAIVKATFAFVHHGPMRMVPAEPILTREAHRMNNPTRSIVATSDLVPRLPGADVLLTGHAHAPGGSAARVVVRLAVGRGEATLLDKRAHVVGDRRGDEIAPFKAIPLVYEKSFGGPGYRDNPLGTGALAGDPPPNVVDPISADRVAGFGPISKSWPSRTQLAAPDVRSGLDKALAEIPAGFDFRYFHAAPADQRVGQLVGDEWIVLEGVHPELPHIHLILPGAMAMVRVVGTESDGRIFSLRADTLRIDADSERCTMVWRNSFPVRENDLGAVRLLAGVALPDAPIHWPDPADLPAGHAGSAQKAARATSALRAPVAAARAAVGHGGTMVIDDSPPRLSGTFSGTIEINDEDLEYASEAAPDFSSTTVLSSTAAPPTQPLPAFFPTPAAVAQMAPPVPSIATAPTTRAPVVLADGAKTLDLTPPETTPVVRPNRAVTPDLTPPETTPVARQRVRNPKESTLDLSEGFGAVAKAILPFADQGRQERASDSGRASDSARVSEPIPGAPWDTGRASQVPTEPAQAEDAGDLAGTLASPTRSPVAPPLVEVAPPASNPPLAETGALHETGALAEAPAAPVAPAVAQPLTVAAPAAAREPPADPWGQGLRDTPPPPPPPPAPPPPRAAGPKAAEPSEHLKNALYKRFKK